MFLWNSDRSRTIRNRENYITRTTLRCINGMDFCGGLRCFGRRLPNGSNRRTIPPVNKWLMYTFAPRLIIGSNQLFVWTADGSVCKLTSATISRPDDGPLKCLIRKVAEVDRIQSCLYSLLQKHGASIFTAHRKASFASAICHYATAYPSVLPSVCLSVTLRYCQNEGTQRDAVCIFE